MTGAGRVKFAPCPAAMAGSPRCIGAAGERTSSGAAASSPGRAAGPIHMVMARVFIAQPMRKLTGGRQEVRVPGATLREVIDNLEREYPGTRDRILKDGALRPGLAAVVGQQATQQGLLHRIDDDDTEVHFLPSIAGGAPDPGRRLPA